MGLVGVILVAVAAALGGVKSNSVLHLRLSGEVPDVATHNPLAALLGNTTVDLWDMQRSLRAAATDERIIGVVVDVRDPAIGFSSLQELEAAMAEFRASGKWSVAFLETAGEFGPGNGAIALAAMADRIVLPPPSEVNLVGLRAEVPFLKGTFEKLNLGVMFEKRYAYKNAANMFTETGFTPEHELATESLLQDLEAGLLEHLQTRRQAKPEVARSWLAKGPYNAEQALELGLVDELGYWDVVLEYAKKQSGRDEPLVSLQKYVKDALRPSFDGPKVALIAGRGNILRGEGPAGLGDETIRSGLIADAFREAREDRVAAVLFRVNSPGGSYIASDLIRREVELTRKAGIPVVVSMGDLAASGGYFVAMDADKIYALPSTLTGSIGVYAGRIASREFFKRWLGVTFDSVQTSPSADFFSGLDLPNADQLAWINAALDRIYKDFVSKAAKARGKSYEQLHEVAQGRVWSGMAAKERGLVDELGGMNEALSGLKALLNLEPQAPVRLVQYPAPKQGLEALQEVLKGARAQLSTPALPSTLQTIKETLEGHNFGDRVLLDPVAPGLAYSPLGIAY